MFLAIDTLFLKNFIFIGKADIQRGEIERKIFRPMFHSPNERNGRCFAGPKKEPLLGLPRGCRVPKLWAVLDCFPGPQARRWKGGGAARPAIDTLKKTFVLFSSQQK